MAFLKDDDCLLVGRDKKDYRISVKDFANEVGGGGDGDHFSGDYNDLANQPAIPDAYTKTQSDDRYIRKNIETLPALP